MIRASLLRCLGAGVALVAVCASAQSTYTGYPNKPITLIAPWPPGGASDAIMRAFAESASAHLGVSVVVAEEELSAEGEGAIEFFEDGSSTGGRVVLQSGQQIRRIDVNWVTGEVSISNASP